MILAGVDEAGRGCRRGGHPDAKPEGRNAHAWPARFEENDAAEA